MLTVTMVGNSREDWCQYTKHVPLNDESRAVRCIVASPRINEEPQSEALQTFQTLLQAFVKGSALAHGNLSAPGLMQQALRTFTGVEGVTRASCAAGLFTSESGVIVASAPVEVHALGLCSSTRKSGKTYEPLTETRALRLFELSPGRLHVVLFPAQAGLLPEAVAARLLTPSEGREQVAERLCAWIRKRTDVPTLVLVYGKPEDVPALFPAIPQNGKVQAPAPALVTPLLDALQGVSDELEKRAQVEANQTHALARIEEGLDSLKQWPAVELYRGLLERLEATQAELVESSIVLPLCRHLMHLHDTLQQAIEDQSGDAELLQALDGQVMSILEEHDITPFNDSGEFDPRTQEAVGSAPAGQTVMRPLRCGFRKGSNIIRREKVVFSSVTKALVESHS